MATKKKRKQAKPRKPPAAPRFSVGAKVRVRHGIADPDFPDIPIGGWAGTITEVNQRDRLPLCLVEWNQSTLDNMHPVFRKRCDRDDLEETSSWLADKDLEADSGEPVPMEQPTQIVTRPLNTGNREDRIRAVFGLTSDDPLPEVNTENLCKYHEHLAAHLTFPFPAIYWAETGPLQSRKYQVSVIGLVDLDDYDPDEGYGLLCEVQHEADRIESVKAIQAPARNRGLLLGILGDLLGLSGQQEEEAGDEDNCRPLDEIEVKKGNPNRRLIADYSYWLHNF